MPDRYTNLQIDSQTGRPCPHLSDDGKCSNPVDIDQCDWIDALETNLESDVAARTNMNNKEFMDSDIFGNMLELLEASYFLMNHNETRHLHSFEFIQRIDVRHMDVHNRVRRARTEEEKQDDKVNVLGPFPEHDGGTFKKIEPEFTVAFFRDFIDRKPTAKAQRRNDVAEFVDTVAASMLDRMTIIRNTEMFCTSRKRRGVSPVKNIKPINLTTSLSPMVAMKLLMRGSIKGFDNNVIKPNMNESEVSFLRENYEFSSNMYKFVYSDNEEDIIQAPFGAEDRPRHFHSKEEAKTFVDEVASAFLEYQGVRPEGDRNDDSGKRAFTNEQKSRFKLWEFAHTKEEDGSYSFKSPRTQPSYDSREVMKNFNEEAIKNFVEAKHHIEKTNQPFFMYCAYRAPHRPFSHIEQYDYTRPGSFIGKAGEQLREFDDRIGFMMKSLEDLNIADNTFVMFTSDNGPDGSGFANQDYAGHVRFGTFRGKKASVYEGGHRVPFLVWWPKGIHPTIWGSNYDLPVSQLDLFSTFADMIKYPLPGGDKCTYGYDNSNSPIKANKNTRSMSEIRREESMFTKMTSQFPDIFKNDENAFYTFDTLRIQCDGSKAGFKVKACPCDNWTNENNPDYDQAVTDKCMWRTNSFVSSDLSICRCMPIKKDCPEGHCFSRVTFSSMKDDMSTITGGREKINKLFYQPDGNGGFDYVGPWDAMSKR